MEPWKNKTWLRDKIINRNMNCEQIANELQADGYKVTTKTIYNWALKLGIKEQTKHYGKRSYPGTRARYY